MVPTFSLRVPLGFALPDGRVRRVIHLLFILWMLSAADLYFTVWAHRWTAFDEANPLARLILDAGSVGGLVVLKLAMTAVGSVIFWGLRRHPRAEIGLWLMVVAYVALMFCWADYTQCAMGTVPWQE